MTNFLIKTFIKNYDQTHSVKVRIGYGRLAGIVGLITNTLISVLKILTGIFSGSIAIIGDGINNLTDASSSVITLIGFKMASKKEDKEHPYGHARYEYIAGMIVSALIIVVGFELVMSSIEKIRDPEPINFSYLIIVILVASVLAKIWQAMFNLKLGKAIDSSTLKATATDSRNDVISTTVVLMSVVIGHFTGFHIDGYMGILVGLFIIYSGVMLIKETADPLIGKAPDTMLVKTIEDCVLEYPGVLGVHDLVVHDYGPGNVFATIHIEVDAREDVLKSHDLIDNIENQVGAKLHLDLVAHMDPIDTKDPLVKELNDYIGKIIEPIDDVLSIHDLRIVKGETHTNVIFDMVLSVDNDESKSNLRKYLQSEVLKKYPNFNLVISYDLDYTVSE